ncbi:hypothetical protein ABG79_01944 [Caloramator mitchellensis]|uniref:Uncharacterized protein n=1 Tax=Caloramator mitchellensis TaxID=908809 RepID=A0A0R3JRV2_CALMK|nr:tetratricopeptide repeat protein [Caloramator mitchellensis]KRQ86214.1 hypothetical protein ABG79_01944 [Caloramator mitchellensis]
MKIGRNDLCPCGSGKKFKKCCIDKIDVIPQVVDITNWIKSLWSYEEVSEMSNEKIISTLKNMGILFDKEAFLADIEKFLSAEGISENWFRTFNVTAKGRDGDFPLLAAWVLWERLAPKNILSMEQMSDLIDRGFEYLDEDESILACETWLKVWEGIKYRIRPEFEDLEYLDKEYGGSFFVRDFCQDLEGELYNAGLDDPKYFEKRIEYCQEFLRYFPKEDKDIIFNMRRAIAESYFKLNKLEEAINEFEKILDDFPNNPWSYIAYADMYCLDKSDIYDIDKAREIYNKGLAVAKTREDKIIIKERLKDLGRL